MANTILEMKNISKSFPGVKALQHVNFDLREGEVHALMGENGAGKSTLMKVLTGIYKMDEGEVYYLDKALKLNGIKDAQDAGISIIHQELNMMNHLTVAENMFIGREISKGGILQDRQVNEEAQKWLTEIGMNDLDPKTKVGDLTVGRQQMVEIAKAVSFNSKVLVLDEPTAALTDTEIESLFKVMRELRDKGVGLIYISHRMDEIQVITDRVTVMRDGQYVGTVDTAKTNRDEIIKMMVGRTIFDPPKQHSTCPKDAKVILEVDNLNAGKMVKDIHFKLHAGEILCFAGLMGAGRTETVRALYGADPKTTGNIKIKGQAVSINHPKEAVKAGICYLSEDRKRYGLALGLNVEQNSVLASLDDLSGKLFVDEKRCAAESEKMVDAMSIKTPSIYQMAKNLSGGNQQKVVIAKWLIRNCDVMIFDEPTRGIDVGAKSEIYKLINDLAKEGKGIIVISSELPEVLRLADRVIVMCEGRITGELGAGTEQETLMQLATKRD